MKTDLNIQVFGTKKCFDTKKAERFFKERGIKYQFIDLPMYGMKLREFEAVARAVGIEDMVDRKNPDSELFEYERTTEGKRQLLFERQDLIRTPIVRNGRVTATVGYCPDVWKTWY